MTGVWAGCEKGILPLANPNVVAPTKFTIRQCRTGRVTLSVAGGPYPNGFTYSSSYSGERALSLARFAVRDSTTELTVSVSGCSISAQLATLSGTGNLAGIPQRQFDVKRTPFTPPGAPPLNLGAEPPPSGSCHLRLWRPLVDANAQALENSPLNTINLIVDIRDQALLFLHTRVLQVRQGKGLTGGLVISQLVSSAYRSREYQAHLREVWEKYMQTRVLIGTGECAATVAALRAHFEGHGLLASQRPGDPNSRKPGAAQHPFGRALDLRLGSVTVNGVKTYPDDAVGPTGLTNAELETQAKLSGLVRPYPVADPVHFELDCPPTLTRSTDPPPPPATCAAPPAGFWPAERSVAEWLSEPAPQSGPPPVRVTVSRRSAGKSAAYDYTVINDGSQAVVAVELGFDPTDGEARLLSLPAGWGPAAAAEEDGISAPAGWEAELTSLEESGAHSVVWRAASAPFVLAPGQTASGFGVTLPRRDESHAAGVCAVTFADGTILAVPFESREPRKEQKLKH